MEIYLIKNWAIFYNNKLQYTLTSIFNITFNYITPTYIDYGKIHYGKIHSTLTNSTNFTYPHQNK